MKNEITDLQVDEMVTSLLRSAGADDDVVDAVADSPSTWWAVQRAINTDRNSTAPSSPFRRWIMFAVPAAAAAVLVISIVVLTGDHELGDGQAVISQQPLSPVSVEQDERSIPAVPVGSDTEIVPRTIENTRQRTVSRTSVPAVARRTSKTPPLPSTAKPKDEIKTEFIALAYGRGPESGQIVRVRVPSSMMVTLGVVTAVEKPTALVDAEVLVGDDGLNHAIRFIR